MPDFVSQLNPTDPTTGLHPAMLALFDAIIQKIQLTSAEKAAMLARLRAQMDITLKGL